VAASCQPTRSAMSGGADPHVAVGYVPASNRPEVAATAAGTRSVTACGWLIIATCELTKTMVGRMGQTNRLRKDSAVSHTSRQPLSMVMECPRFSIDAISVTPGFFCCSLNAASLMAGGEVLSPMP
jgi:hypothetical protein